MNKELLKPFFLRLGVITAVSFVFAFGFNEAMYALQREPADRSPTTISIAIPAGAAERIAAGEEAVSLPEEISFVIGDVLEVHNEDSVPHQLGPIWVPPGATGRLVMDTAERQAYTCSFSTNKYLGLDVRPGTTAETRIIALFLTVPTLATLIFLYSLAMHPIRARSNDKAGA